MQGDSRNDKIYALLLWLAAAVWLQKTGNEPLRKRRRGIGNTGSPQRV